MKSNRAIDINGFCALLEGGERFLLVCHIHPDGDTLGSAMAMARILRLMGKNASVFCPDKIPERLLPFCGEEYFVPALPQKAERDFVIAVDVPAPEQLGAFRGELENGTSLTIDHHGNSVRFSDFYENTAASSVGEMVFDIAETLRSRGTLKDIDSECAELLYLAISSDTGAFKYGNTTPKAMHTAAKLIEYGIDFAKTNKLLYMTEPIEHLRAQAITINNLCVLFGGTFAVTLIDEAARGGLSYEAFETAVDIARSVKGTRFAASIKQKEGKADEFRVSMRSDGDFDVSLVCSAFGGGGHKAASACNIFAKDIESALALLVAEIKRADSTL